MSGLGGGGVFRLAESCPVAEVWANGQYMSHQGGEDHLVADATTRGGGAAIRLVLWRCVHCGVLLVGVGRADEAPAEDQEFTWLEETVPLLNAAAAHEQALAGVG